jgi:hypothetical protein
MDDGDDDFRPGAEAGKSIVLFGVPGAGDVREEEEEDDDMALLLRGVAAPEG